MRTIRLNLSPVQAQQLTYVHNTGNQRFISGTALGTVIFMLLSGMIAANLGWKWVFYIEGLASLIWCVAWSIMVKDTPKQQTMIITSEELEYIMSSQGQTKDSHNMVRGFVS